MSDYYSELERELTGEMTSQKPLEERLSDIGINLERARAAFQSSARKMQVGFSDTSDLIVPSVLRIVFEALNGDEAAREVVLGEESTATLLAELESLLGLHGQKVVPEAAAEVIKQLVGAGAGPTSHP